MEYHIEIPSALWIYPLSAILGILLQLIAIYLKSGWMLAGGLLLALFGAYGDDDITLGLGSLLVAGGFALLRRFRNEQE